jgi:hypothetical protein
MAREARLFMILIKNKTGEMLQVQMLWKAVAMKVGGVIPCCYTSIAKSVWAD